jgi:hypothetical protein
MLVKYCGRDCQIAHRPQHKNVCKMMRAAELHEELLFRQPPKEDDCPICFLVLPKADGMVGVEKLYGLLRENYLWWMYV